MSPQNQPSNQYDFIMSKEKAVKPKVTLPAGSQNQRIIVFAGIIVLVLIFVVFITKLAGRGGEDKAQFVGLIQQQSELVRVATLGTGEQSANADLRNTATNISLAVSSDKQQLIAVLAKKNIKLKGKEINGVANQKTTTLLTNARAAANFDSTLITTLSDEMDDYQGGLEKMYNQTKSRSIKASISQAYQNTQVLQKQLEATQP